MPGESAKDNINRLAWEVLQSLPSLRKKFLGLEEIRLRFGIPISHLQVLAALRDSGSMSVSEISQTFGIARPNVTPLVDRLTGEGYVERMRNERDRRVVDISITERGRDKLDEIHGCIAQNILIWSEQLNSEQFERLGGALNTLFGIIHTVGL